MLTPFHLAVAVNNLDQARHFYGELLGFEEGRSSDHWIDFNLFGHQFVVHLDEHAAEGRQQKESGVYSLVDNHRVPIPHFGVVLQFEHWQDFADKLMQVIPEYVQMPPTIRFRGEPGEQGTVFFLDPFGNALEFKGFHNIDASLFAH